MSRLSVRRQGSVSLCPVRRADRPYSPDRCAVCGRKIDFGPYAWQFDRDAYVYKRKRSHARYDYYCSYGCMRKDRQ